MAFCGLFASHLDPFGCVTIFLDAAFRNVSNNGVIVATCTDVASLYGTCPAPALHNYGTRIARTDFVKEMAARVIVSALARSGAVFLLLFAEIHSCIVIHFISLSFNKITDKTLLICRMCSVHSCVICGLVYEKKNFCRIFLVRLLEYYITGSVSIYFLLTTC